MDAPLTWKADGPTVWEQTPDGAWFLVGSFCAPTPSVQNRPEVTAVARVIRAATGVAPVAVPRDSSAAARVLLRRLKDQLGHTRQTP